MVALFNGVGGGAAALVALVELHEIVELDHAGLDVETFVLIATAFTVLVGSVSFSGSIVTFAKLQELMTSRPVVFPGLPVVFGGVPDRLGRPLRAARPRAHHGPGHRARPGRPARRRTPRAARRRRGRAHRHLAAQRLHRPDRGRRRLRPEQHPAARRRHARRRLRHVPDPADGQRHGPLGVQHPVRRAQGRLHARRRRGLRPAGPLGRARGRRDPARVRRQGDHRPRLRPGRRPGPAHPARAGRRPGRRAAPRSTTRSTRSRAGCPAT